MTLKELFKKVEAYNEIADLMNSRKAKINFYVREQGICFGEVFDSYESLRRHVRKEYIKELADVVLKSSEYEMDKEIEVTYTDYFGTSTNIVCAYLVAD